MVKKGTGKKPVKKAAKVAKVKTSTEGTTEVWRATIDYTVEYGPEITYDEGAPTKFYVCQTAKDSLRLLKAFITEIPDHGTKKPKLVEIKLLKGGK